MACTRHPLLGLLAILTEMTLGKTLTIMRLISLLLAAQLALGASILPIPFGADVVPGKFIGTLFFMYGQRTSLPIVSVALKEDASESTLTDVVDRVQSVLGVTAPRLFNMRTFKAFTLESEALFLEAILGFSEVCIQLVDTQVATDRP